MNILREALEYSDNLKSTRMLKKNILFIFMYSIFIYIGSTINTIRLLNMIVGLEINIGLILLIFWSNIPFMFLIVFFLLVYFITIVGIEFHYNQYRILSKIKNKLID